MHTYKCDNQDLSIHSYKFIFVQLVSNYTVNFFLANSPVVKKCVAPKNAVVKKIWNPKWWPRNGCDNRLKAKNLIMTIQVNLCRLIHISLRFSTKFTWIVFIKMFAFNLLSQPFLDCHFGFHIFFHNRILGGHTLFIAGLFWTLEVGRLHACYYLSYSS